MKSGSVTDKRKLTNIAIYTGLVVILAILPLLSVSPYILHVLILIFIYVIATVSLRAIAISGQLSLAHGAFMGIGAYVAGMLAKWLGWSPWLTIPVAALTTAGIGMLIGYPFARLRAIYYLMGSLFFGIGIINLIAALGDITGGYSGLPGIPFLFPGIPSKMPSYYFFLVLTTVCLILLYRYEFCRIGTTMKAISQSHLVASSVGINEVWFRVLAVGVGSFFVGIAGAGYAHYSGVISPTCFNFMATLWLVIYMLIGGMQSFAGPIIGTFVLILIPEFFRDFKMYSPYFSAGILLIVAYLMPQGIMGLPNMIESWWKRTRQNKRTSNVT
jgi:branched-chain amino acid transport system permease protein